MHQERYRVDPLRAVGEIIDGEAVMINLKSGDYFSANDVGAEIWGYVERECSVARMLELIGSRYGGTRAEHEAALTAFLGALREHGLIVESEGDDGPDATTTDPVPEPSKEGSRPMPFTPPTLSAYSDMQELLLLDPIHDVAPAEGWPSRKG